MVMGKLQSAYKNQWQYLLKKSNISIVFAIDSIMGIGVLPLPLFTFYHEITPIKTAALGFDIVKRNAGDSFIQSVHYWRGARKE